VASFLVWLREHKDRLRLEQESGPDVFIDISEVEGQELLQFKNVRSDPALNVQLKENDDVLKLGLVRWIIPLVEIGKPESVRIEFCQARDHATILAHVNDYFDQEGKTATLRILFGDSKGAVFSRSFELRRPLLSAKVDCFPIGTRQLETVNISGRKENTCF
jgi:hypothetical protein